MFTGIIEAQGHVTRVERKADSLQITLPCPFEGIVLGESIAINGACLTVAQILPKTRPTILPNTPPESSHDLVFFISAETLEKTNLGEIQLNSLVNLERAITLSTRLSGHIVQGHVDGKAQLVEVAPIGESYRMKWQLPAQLARYCISKGSITLNGVSLTINALTTANPSDPLETCLEIMVIPHTWTHTNLSHLRIRDEVNVEVDLLAKYVERLCKT